MFTLTKLPKTDILKTKLQNIDIAIEAIRNINRVASGNEVRVGGELVLWGECYETMLELRGRVVEELETAKK